MGFFLCLGLLALLLLPVLFNQLISLAGALPGYVSHLQERYEPQVRTLFSQMEDGQAADMLHNAAQSVSGYLLGALATAAGDVVRSGFALVNIFSLIFVTPVVAFYLLRDWDVLTARVNELLPRRHARIIRTQLRAIDDVLAGFVRGQTNVCLFLSVFYSIALTLVGLHYGLALAITTGFLTFIPYVGALFGLCVGILLAFVQYNDLFHVLIVGGIFLLGQFIEANFVAPRLVGKKVGLHPVWIIFGLLSGGALFGFLGVLMAVPVTAVIGVLMRFALTRYQESRLYTGVRARS